MPPPAGVALGSTAELAKAAMENLERALPKFEARLKLGVEEPERFEERMKIGADAGAATKLLDLEQQRMFPSLSGQVLRKN